MTLPAHPDPETPKAQAAAHYASVSEQIDEIHLDIAQRKAKIVAMQDAIKAERNSIRDAEFSVAKLKKRKRIFARARFDLEQVDEE